MGMQGLVGSSGWVSKGDVQFQSGGYGGCGEPNG